MTTRLEATIPDQRADQVRELEQELGISKKDTDAYTVSAVSSSAASDTTGPVAAASTPVATASAPVAAAPAPVVATPAPTSTDASASPAGSSAVNGMSNGAVAPMLMNGAGH